MKRLIAFGLPGLLSGCATADKENLPLVFGRTQNFGVNLSGSVPEQGGGLSLGFTDRNIAVVPIKDGDGKPLLSQAGAGDSMSKDALSVLGQFQASADQKSMSTSLGTFFSTGTAAGKLAEGFAAQMGYGRTCEYDADGKVKRCGDMGGSVADEAPTPAQAPTTTPTPSPGPAGGGQ
jgi:hypothetical protein